MPVTPFLGTLLVLLGIVSTAGAQALDEPSLIEPDERVVFFPTAAHWSEDERTWTVPIAGWIFEPEQNDFFRALALQRLRKALDLDPEAPSTEIFNRRARLFLVDSERGKRVGVRIAGREHTFAASDGDGHFDAVLKIPADAIAREAADGRLRFQAITSADDEREFTGVAHLLPPTGLSVISDIDDTIKITQVGDRRKLIENTFFRPFRPVEGMAAVYRRWADAGAEFHFVSSSPWQLYETLSAFASEAGFPDATYHLSRFRLTGRSFAELFDNPLEGKRRAIEPMLANSPKRKFVLVGDSGQQDPELYGMVARAFPRQVVRIYIRDVGENPDAATRYREAFQDVPEEVWQIFRNPRQLRLPQEGS